MGKTIQLIGPLIRRKQLARKLLKNLATSLHARLAAIFTWVVAVWLTKSFNEY